MKRSYNVGFLVMSEHSSYNAAFGLARALQERGHNAVFLANNKTVFPQYVIAHGFKVVEIPEVPRHKIPKFRLFKRLKTRKHNIKLEQSLLADLIKKNSLDLCLLDSVRYDLFPFALVLAKLGIPTILLSYTFGSRLQFAYPPVFSSAIPSGTTPPSVRSRSRYALLWAWAIVSTRGRVRFFGPLEYAERVIACSADMVRNISFERALRRLGYRSTWSEWKRRPLIPEIVFGHRALDWPTVASSSERYYFGTTDLFRKRSEFDWSAFDANRPIIYCSISTAGGFEKIGLARSNGNTATSDLSKRKFRLAKRYLEVILETFSQREDWQLILACGPFYESFQRAAYKANIKVFERLPQLTVLTRADLAITWGGAGTVRECINFGVPMLVFPAWTDQFGNAARVQARNAGIRGDILSVTSTKMMEMIERVLTDKTIRTSVLEIRKQSDVKEEIRGLVDFVSRYASLDL
jgi:zeaxanthin glucosyltransferase